MSSEQNMAEVELHQGPPQGQIAQDNSSPDGSNPIPHGMGQSKSSRRRRRKRKNKMVEANQQTSQGGSNVPFTGDVQAAGQGFAPPQSQPQPQQGFSQQNGGGQSGKRWKKKFRERPRGENPGNQASGFGGGYRDKDTHQPGNNALGGGKRKGKQQRGPRSFVGPMDHSYRAVNGNYADAPPSTIETHGNYQPRSGGRSYVSDSQPIDYSIGRPVPIPEDAPTKIFFFIEDLFFNAKITETARKLGVKVGFVKNDKEAIAELTGLAEADRPGLIVFDLNNANAKPLTLIPKLKTKLKKSTSIVGFLSHLQGDLKAKAVEAGCDVVMPRAAFSQNLPNLLRRYGLQEEEEEANFNQ